MARANFMQTNFLGGEWSPFFQGRAEHPKYRSAMNVCRNGYPIEEGTWVRRSGTRLCAPTFKGQEGKVYPFYFSDLNPYTVEFTDGNIRFFNGNWLVITEEAIQLTSLSTANPAVITLQVPVAWSTGDEIAFLLGPSVSPTIGQNLRQRTFLVTKITETYSTWDSGTAYNNGDIVTYSGKTYISLQIGNTNNQPDISAAWWSPLASGVTRTYSLADAVTGTSYDGSSTVLTGMVSGSIMVVRILRIATPYTNAAWTNARIVQNESVAIILNGTNKPQFLSITPNATFNGAASASCVDLVFKDGPYLDHVNNSQATMGGSSGVVTMSVDFITWSGTTTYAAGDHVKYGTSAYKSLVGGNLNKQPDVSPTYWQAEDRGVAVTGPDNAITGFQNTDVGRLVRLFSEPATWVSGGYTKGDKVKWNGVYYIAQNNNSGEQPDLFPADWTVDPTGANWTWGQITSITNSNSCQVQIMGDALANGSSLPINDWRLGIYSDTTGYPTCGVFCEGRIWLGGALPNRFDACVVDGVSEDGVCDMAPTLSDGTVTDASAIGYTLEARERNPITWFANDHLGIIVGTAGGEWLLSASQLSDPFTPTSIQARQVTQYKCADIEPRRTGLSLVFVQRFKRRLMELLADVFTGRFVAPHLTETAKHLTSGSIEDIAYQEELVPILWMRKGDGTLAGATYRRVSAFTTEAPAFAGFHKHDLGTGRTIESIAVGPSVDGSLDSLMAVTNDAATNIRWVEMFTQMFDEDDALYNSWFVDGGIVPDNYYTDTVAGVSGVRFTGLWYLSGTTQSVVVNGLDLGDIAVDSNGTLFVPFGNGVKPASIDYTIAGAGTYLFTQAYLTTLIAEAFSPRNGGVGSGVTTITTTTVATNPNTTSKILQYVFGSGTPADGGAVADWTNGKIILPDSTGNTVHVFNANTGAELASATVSTITSAAETSWPLQAGSTDPSGNFYFGGGSVLSGDLIGATEALTLNYIKTGTWSYLGVGSMTTITANASWLVGSSTGAFGNAGISMARASDGSAVTINDLSGALPGAQFSVPLVGAGAATHGGNIASSYIATVNSNTIYLYFVGVADGIPTGNDPILNPGGISKGGFLHLKKVADPASITMSPSVDNPITEWAQIGTISPTTIDAGWLTLSYWAMWIDKSDNSVILGVTNGSAGKICKFSTGFYSKDNTGSFGLVWSVPVNGFPGAGTIISPQQSQIVGGLLGYFSPTADGSDAALYLIDTTTGKYSVVDVPGIVVALSSAANQVWDDQTQSIIFWGNYNASATGAPAGIGGTTTGTNQWYRLYVGTDLSLSSNISSTTNVQPTGYTFVTATTSTSGIPAAVGKTFTSQGQILRPIAPDESGARSGPAFGMFRRLNWFVLLLRNTIGISIGTDFTRLQAASLKDDAGVQPDPTTMYSGLWSSNQIDDKYSYDGMLAWQIVRPYPASVVAVGATLETQDR